VPVVQTLTHLNSYKVKLVNISILRAVQNLIFLERQSIGICHWRWRDVTCMNWTRSTTTLKEDLLKEDSLESTDLCERTCL